MVALIRLCFLCCALLLAGPLSQAQPAPSKSAARAGSVLPPDRAAAVRLRQPPAQQLRELRARREFQYVEVKSEQSSWDLFWAQLGRWLSKLLATRSGKVAWQYGIYALLLGALVYAVLKLLQVDLTRAFGRAPRAAPLPYDTAAEDIHTLDFPALIGAAESDGNLRLAVRLGYLFVLKQLTDQGFIQWQPDKTNHDYGRELTAGNLRPGFRELTRQFEFVWYGEQNDLTPAQYALARDARVAFQRELTTTRRAA